MQILMFIQMQILWKIVAINAVWCFVRYNVHFKVCASQLAVCRQRWSTTISNTLTQDGYSSVNITARRCKCKRVCDSCQSPLSGDRTVKVGHQIMSVCVLPYINFGGRAFASKRTLLIVCYHLYWFQCSWFIIWSSLGCFLKGPHG